MRSGFVVTFAYCSCTMLFYVLQYQFFVNKNKITFTNALKFTCKQEIAFLSRNVLKLPHKKWFEIFS